MSDAMAPIDQQVDTIVAHDSITEGVAAAVEGVEADQMQTDDNLIPSSNGDDSLMIDEAPVVETEILATEDADSKEGIVPVAELSSASAPSINLAQTLADPLEEGTPAPLEEASSFIASAIRGSKAVVPASTSLGGATSKLAQLTARLAKDPTDGEARLALLKDVEARGDLERTREVYEEFLTVFPDASKQWIAYADLELSHGLFARVEEIFARCLRPSPSVDLWKFYLDYIRRVNPIEGDRAKDARALIGKSFEFALQHVGQDRRAGEMWTENIEFLKQSGDTRGTWEDQQRMDSLRKAYQRAVCIPLNNVEQIWQDYNLFENNLNKMTAKKFVSELSPSYMTARKALRELRAMYDDLHEPALPSRPEWSSQDRSHLEKWKKYLAYEEANPLDIEEASSLNARVQFAFKKAVGSLRFFSEIWLLASNFFTKSDQIEDAAAALRSGMTANPSSLLLAYTLAEYQESKGELASCYSIYDALISHFHSRIDILNAETESETVEALREFDALAATTKLEDNDADANANGEDVESRQKKIVEKEEITIAIKAKRASAVEKATNAAANVWITELRFARRAEDLKAARSVFAKARKSPFPTWRVIEAAATLELYWNKDAKVATNVFEFGLKAFGSEPDYVKQYLDFLIKSNNDSNARALFERSVAKIEPVKAKPIWDRWAEYEYQYGDFAAAQRLAARYSEAFPEVSPLERFISRHGYPGLDESIVDDLGTLSSTIEEPSQPHRDERSPSPSRLNKRRRSAEPSFLDQSARNRSPDRERYGGRVGEFRDPNDGGAKRVKQYHRDSASPGPSDDRRGGPPPSRDASAWGRVPKEEPRDDFDGRSRRREAPKPDLPPPQILHMLDPRGDVTGPVPDGVLFFLSILPSSASFNGPVLDPLTVVEVISNAILPGSAPGGFAGERLGIPPRRKPASSSYQEREGGRERERERSPSPGPYRGGGGGDRGGDYGYGGGYGGGGGGRPRY